MVVALPAGQGEPPEALFEVGGLLRHDVQPAQVVVQVASGIRDVESLAESALEGGGGPRCSEDGRVLLPDLGLHESVDVFRVHPDHRLHQLAQAHLQHGLLAQVAQHVVPDDDLQLGVSGIGCSGSNNAHKNRQILNQVR